MNGYFMVEIIIRKNADNSQEVERYREQINKYLFLETNDRVICSLPTESEWFKNGLITELLRSFGQNFYMAVAYITTGDELVCDFFRNSLLPYDVTIEGRLMKKYVKKKLIIMEESETSIKILGYMLNPKLSNPIVEALNIYALKNEVKINGIDITLDKVLDEIL